MADRLRAPSMVRTAGVWDILRAVLEDQSRVTRRQRLDILDAGGGTGGFAVPLAELGHAVTVVDPSPDSLAALERRAADAGVAVTGIQGEAVELPDVVGRDSADLVLCHSMLEYVDEPVAALTAVAAVTRPGGAVSVLVANRIAAVIHRALSGYLEDALHALADPVGRWGERDPVPRRFTVADLTELLTAVQLTPGAVHGVRVFADLVPSGLVDGEPRAEKALTALESVAALHPILRDLATQLHILGRR